MANATTPPLDSIDSIAVPALSGPTSSIDLAPAASSKGVGTVNDQKWDSGEPRRGSQELIRGNEEEPRRGSGAEPRRGSGAEPRRESAGSARRDSVPKEKQDTTSSFRPKNGCQQCCGSIMNFFANDAIYGSFIGPHPVSFFCICQPCKNMVSRGCARPLCVASIVTKVMNFIMLAIITLLSCFFIFPWFVSIFSLKQTTIDSFYSCQGKNVWNKEFNGGCEAHAGYFMAYRCFLAFAGVMLTNCFAMADVTSTSDDPYRKRIHHGFWCYKYLYLFVLLLFFFLFLDGSTDEHGYFEYTMSIIGNVAHVFFSLFELMIILDILEISVISMRMSNNGWAHFMYALMTCFTFLVDIVAFIAIFTNFAFKLKFDILNLRNKAARWVMLTNSNTTLAELSNQMGNQTTKNISQGIKELFKVNHTFTSVWPHTNCLPGEYLESSDEGGFFGFATESTHFVMITGALILITILVVVMALKQRFMERYPFQGWLQVGVIILFDLFYLWSALFNSEQINSRPRCNWALRMYARENEHSPASLLQTGSHDTYFRYSGFFHGLIAVFSLLYYAFVHGPRSKTAPLSLAFRHFIAGGYDRVPIYPDPQNTPPDFKQAVEKLEVWDDEQDSVAQSWSFFYLMMVFGSLSLMMSMTNFTDPWAKARYNSSNKAMYFKYISMIVVTLAYIFMLICPCTRVYKAYQTPTRRIRKARVDRPHEEGAEEQGGDGETIIELDDDDYYEEAWY